MEPFELTLSQVNFEEKDLGPEHSLHSFSNLVSYDSDFKVDNEAQEGAPVRAKLLTGRSENKQFSEHRLSELNDSYGTNKQLVNSGVSKASSVKTKVSEKIVTVESVVSTKTALNKHRNSEHGPDGGGSGERTHGSGGGTGAGTADLGKSLSPGNEAYPESHQSDTNNLANSFDGPDVARNAELGGLAVPPYLQVQAVQEHGQPKSIYQPGESFAFEPNTDSFKAFTGTVEALSLQRSVIDETGTVEAHMLQRAVTGGSTVTPASAEEVARAIAAAQKQFQQQNEEEEAKIVDTMDVAVSNGVHSATPSDTDSLASMPSAGTTVEVPVPDVVSSATTSENTDSAHNTIRSQVETLSAVAGSIEASVVNSSIPDGNKSGTSKKKKKKKSPGSKPRESATHGELIRMPVERITTITEKSSWFSSQSKTNVQALEGKSDITQISSESLHHSGGSAEHSVNLSNGSENQDLSGKTLTSDSYEYRGSRSVARSTIHSQEMENKIYLESTRHSPSGRHPKWQQDSVELGSQEAEITGTSLDESYMYHTAVTSLSSSNMNMPHVPVDASTPLKSSTTVDGQKVVQHVSSSDPNVGTAAFPSVTNEGEALSHSSSLNSNVDYFNSELDRVLREKAKLEGQIEILEAEARSAIKERAELQAKVAALEQMLKSQESSAQGVVGDRDALAADLETLKSNRSRLEVAVMDAQHLLEDKDVEIQTLQEDLRLAHEAHEKTLEMVNSSKQDIIAKDSTIQALKNKVAELYVDFQTSNQNKILAENEVKSLSSELKSLATAKEWYQEQLRLAQEAKTGLQSQITSLQGDSIAQATAIERSRAENVRLKNQLSEAQQRMLAEKELLARTLEAIEADMMEREAAFAQMQRERESMEAALQAGQQAATGATYMELQEDLQKSQNELRRKTAQVGVMEHEQAELVKRITLAQESILERDRTIETSDRRYVEVEVHLRQLETQLSNKEQEINEVNQIKNMMEVELTSLKEEKKTFDSALQTLKGDMGKVEQSFRQMKSELDAKEQEVQTLKSDKEALHRQMGLEHVETEQRQRSSVDALVRQAAPELAATHFPRPVKEEVLMEAKAIQCDELYVPADISKMQQESALLEQVKSQKSALESEITALQRSNEALNSQLMSERKCLEMEVAALEADLTAANSKEKVNAVEISKYQQELVVTKERILEMEVKLQTVTEEKSKLDTQVVVSSVDEEALRKLSEENSHLKAELADLQQKSHREIAKQRAKSLKLGVELEGIIRDSRTQEKDLEMQIAELSQQLRATEEARARAAADLETVQQRFNLSLDEQKAQLQEQIQLMKSERLTIEEQKTTISLELLSVHKTIEIRDNELADSHHELATLQAEMAALRTTLEQRKQRDEDTKRLLLELEREKGRLAGVRQSHSALKDHTSSLEAALARHESSAVAFSSHFNEELEGKEREVLELKDAIKEMEDTLEQEKNSGLEIKKQLLSEKGGHVKLRREMETLRSEHTQMSTELGQKADELAKLASELEKSHESELKYKMEKEQIGAEFTGCQRELERLHREAEERKTKDQLISEQIKNLEWQVGQKAAELEAALQKIQLVEERQQMEVENLQKSLQSSTGDLSALRDEIAAVKREKLVLQAKVAELKNALKASVKAMKSERTSNLAAGTGGSTFDMAAIERLLVDTSPLTVQSKPLSFLQATLSGLRGEIGSLQRQVDEHTAAVESSSKAWRELELHVRDLREVCRTSAQDRAASEHLTHAMAYSRTVETSSGTFMELKPGDNPEVQSDEQVLY